MAKEERQDVGERSGEERLELLREKLTLVMVELANKNKVCFRPMLAL